MKYFLFLDECGNFGLIRPNQEFPVFVLCGVLVTETNYEIVRQESNKIKIEIWNDKRVILHSRDIRKCKNEFKTLLNPEVKKRFYGLINDAVSNLPFTIVASGIQNNLLIEQLDKPEHSVYNLAFSFIIEQVVEILQKQGGDNQLAIVIEKRGDKEDRLLYNHFRSLCSIGTSALSPVDLDEVCPSFTSRNKLENINGLQLADLVAYPIARYLIQPEKANPAFEIVKNKIYKSGSNWYGIKVFP